MTPGPENPLEEAAVMARDNVEARPEFYRRLMNANLFLIGRFSEQTQLISIGDSKPNKKLSLSFVTRGDRRFHPAFSSVARLRAFAGDERNVLTLPARGLFESTRGASFVINPGWEFGKELIPEEIDYWLGQTSIASAAPGDAPRRLVRPDPFPTLLAKALSVLFVNRPILSACLLQVEFADPAEPSRLLLGVETEADWRKTVSEVAETVVTATPELSIEIIRIDRSKTEHPLIGPLLRTAPFYERSKFIE